MVLPLADHANEQNDYMWNHAPNDYLCPFCQNIASGEGSFPVEILHRYDDVVVKMNPRWRRDNPGAALVIPIERASDTNDLRTSQCIANVGFQLWSLRRPSEPQVL